MFLVQASFVTTTNCTGRPAVVVPPSLVATSTVSRHGEPRAVRRPSTLHTHLLGQL